jgi:hypothetical protein
LRRAADAEALGGFGDGVGFLLGHAPLYQKTCLMGGFVWPM